jgi:hypothetical protein
MQAKMQIYAEILRQIGRMPNDYKEPDLQMLMQEPGEMGEMEEPEESEEYESPKTEKALTKGEKKRKINPCHATNTMQRPKRS